MVSRIFMVTVLLALFAAAALVSRFLVYPLANRKLGSPRAAELMSQSLLFSVLFFCWGVVVETSLYGVIYGGLTIIALLLGCLGAVALSKTDLKLHPVVLEDHEGMARTQQVAPVPEAVSGQPTGLSF